MCVHIKRRDSYISKTYDSHDFGFFLAPFVHHYMLCALDSTRARTHTRTHVHTHAHTQTRTHMYVYTHPHTHTHTHIHTHTSVYVYISMYVFVLVFVSAFVIIAPGVPILFCTFSLMVFNTTCLRFFVWPLISSFFLCFSWYSAKR